MIDRGHPSRLQGSGRRAPGRRERKKEKVRNALYRAALELFEEQGYDETSVQQICERADVAKGTFFNHFPSKDHVLLALHDQWKTALLEEVRGRTHGSAEAAIVDCFGIWAERLRGERRLGRILARRMFLSEVLEASDRHHEDLLEEWLVSRVREGTASGELRPDLEVDVFLSLLFAALSSATQGWILGDGQADLGESLAARARFLFRAAQPSSSTRRTTA